METVFTIWLGLVIFLGGAALASYFTVASQRGWKGSVKGRSHCDHCKKVLPAWTLVPLLATLYLLVVKKSRSHCCGKSLDLKRYLLAEGLGGVTALLLFLQLSSSESAVAVTLFSLVSLMFLYLAIDDIWHLGIEVNALAILAITLVVIGVVFPGEWEKVLGHRIFSEGSLSAAGIYGLIVLALIVLSGGKGLGVGDLVLIVIMAFGLGGWQVTLALQVAIYTAAFSGLLYSAHKGKYKGLIIPLVPFLLLGWLTAPILASPVLDYLQLASPTDLLCVWQGRC